MTTMPNAAGEAGQGQAAREQAARELVVDARDQRIVSQRLVELVPGLVLKEKDRSPELGLVLLELSDPMHTAVDPLTGVDELQSRLELSFRTDAARTDAAGFGRWCPVFAANYLDGDVHTWPHVKIGVGDPVPVEELDVRSADYLLPVGAPEYPRVGIADAPVFPHPDLAGRYLGEVGEVGPDTFASPARGHATLVAGTILRRAPKAQLVVRRVLDEKSGRNPSSWDVAKTLVRFLRDDVAVINMSFGCATSDGAPPLALRRAVERLAGTVVLVAAAGNHGQSDLNGSYHATPTTPMWPAALGDVVAVGGAQDDAGHPAEWSPQLPWINLMAPGVGVTGTFTQGVVTLHSGTVSDFKSGYARWGGSSFAAAAVTGEIVRRMYEQRVDAFDACAQLLDGQAAGTGIVPFRYHDDRGR